MSSYLVDWFDRLRSLIPFSRSQTAHPLRRPCDSTIAVFENPPPRSGDELGWHLQANFGEPDSEEQGPPQRHASSYHDLRMEEEIGVGGMGTILRAREAALGRELAVKVIAEELAHNPVAIRRFLDEARMTAELQHPGFVPVYSLGNYFDGRPYFTMKLIHGQSLLDALQERSPEDRELPRFLRIFEQVAHALAYCHDKGIVHRDIKPSNIMLGRHGEVFLMDFGLAFRVPPSTSRKTQSAEHSGVRPAECGEQIENPFQSGYIYGSPAYMAPEQAAGQDGLINERIDVFALGATLYEILTAEPLYQGDSVLELVRIARKADLVEKFDLLNHCGADAEIIAICRRCLEPDVRARYQNGKEIQSAVTEYLESILRRPERDLNRFFELCPDLFCIAGMDGYFHRVNRNFSRVLGHADAELISRPFISFVHPEDHDKTLAAIRVLEQGKPLTRFTNRYRTSRGSYLWFEWTAQAIVEESIIFAVARDITGSDRQYQGHSPLETGSTGMLLLREDATIQGTNPCIENLFGYSQKELLGRTLDLVLRKARPNPPSRNDLPANSTLNPRALIPGMILLARHKSGREFPVEIGVSNLSTTEGELIVLRFAERPHKGLAQQHCSTEAAPRHGTQN